MITQSKIITETVLEVAKKMAISAETAPKGKGRDTLEIKILTNDEIISIADRMEQISEEQNLAFFKRDANNIRNSQAVLLIGTSISALHLSYCGFCGLENCENKNKNPEVPCSFNTIDLGIAIGSAVSVATDNRVDNRIFFSVGKAVKELDIMSDNTKVVFGIGLSVSSKNIFFDRK